jgi:hypothetical protein
VTHDHDLVAALDAESPVLDIQSKKLFSPFPIEEALQRYARAGLPPCTTQH